MPELPRGTCPVCGRDVALRAGGALREHRTRKNKNGPPAPACAGSGRIPGQLPIPGTENHGS